MRSEIFWAYWPCIPLKAESSLLADHCRRPILKKGACYVVFFNYDLYDILFHDEVAPRHSGKAVGDAADGTHAAGGGVEAVG